MKPGELYEISNSYFQKFNVQLSIDEHRGDTLTCMCASADKENPNIFWCVPVQGLIGLGSRRMPVKNNNNLETRQNSNQLGEIPLVYGTLRGREDVVKAGEKSPNKNNNIADSYLGELNLGLDFMQLRIFSRKYADGTLNEQDLEGLVNFKDHFFDQSAKYYERQMSSASPDANRELLNLMLGDNRIQNILTKLSRTHEELFEMENRNETLGKFNNLTREFFSIKTKLVLEKTLEGNGQIYFPLNEIVTDKEKNIDFNRLPKVFDETGVYYNTVTSDELRFTLENYLDHPNLKFMLDKQVIELPDDTKKEIRNIAAQRKVRKEYDEIYWAENMLPVTEKYNCGKAALPPQTLINEALKNRVIESVQESIEHITPDLDSKLHKNVQTIRTELMKELQCDKGISVRHDSYTSKTSLKELLFEAASGSVSQDAGKSAQTLIPKSKKRSILEKYTKRL